MRIHSTLRILASPDIPMLPWLRHPWAINRLTWPESFHSQGWRLNQFDQIIEQAGGGGAIENAVVYRQHKFQRGRNHKLTIGERRR